MNPSVSVVVFTRDLRVRDHPALVAASNADRIVPLFVVDDDLVRRSHRSANRLRFLVESLTDLDQSLRERGAALVVRRGTWADEVARIVAEVHADAVHVSDDVSGFARTRFDSLRAVGTRRGFDVIAHPGVTVTPPGAVVTGSGTTYQVFTPFYVRWLATEWRRTVAAPTALTLPDALDPGEVPVLRSLTLVEPSPGRIRGGERAAITRMREWSADRLEHYARDHNAIAADATSKISPYLHFGCLSPLEVATLMRSRPGGTEFVRQLCWRDFFHQLLASRPELAREDLRRHGTPTGTDDEAFTAWCEGRTGYPLVDAGMRQLLTEGFMHNRVRMVTASFLTKDLDIAWQLGARHFMNFLVDGDVASNQLNWQWVAGTGTDSNPNRVFNPTRQSERFDPDGAYIRRYVGELAHTDTAIIHDPPESERQPCGYPEQLVDHRDAVAGYRQRRSAAPPPTA